MSDTVWWCERVEIGNWTAYMLVAASERNNKL
jgi:hypothetical protein